MFNNLKRAGVVGVATVALAGVGVASAAWMTEGFLNVGGQTAKLTPVTGSATVSPALFPGMKGDLAGSIKNPNPVAVKVTINGGTVDSACASLAVPTGSGLGVFELAPGETKDVQMLNVVKLADDAPDSCQNVSFTVRLHTQTTAGS